MKFPFSNIDISNESFINGNGYIVEIELFFSILLFLCIVNDDNILISSFTFKLISSFSSLKNSCFVFFSVFFFFIILLLSTSKLFNTLIISF